MSWGFVLVLALGLSMDALAVSVAQGVIWGHIRLRQVLVVAFSFGLFQGVMPVLGWLAGSAVADMISAFDHWVAFGLLVLIGLKMIHEGWGEGSGAGPRNCQNLATLLLMSLATSMDALAVGLSFAFLEVPIWGPVLLIAAVTFLVSALGVYAGRWMRRWVERHVFWVGGLILILIGLRILWEHRIHM